MDAKKAWDRLCAVRELVFEARSGSATNSGWTGSGRGTVQVEHVDAMTILFHEQGSWTPEGGQEIRFTNVFRWTTAPDRRLMRLEHLRFGPDKRVYLFDVVPVSEGVLESAEPHVCSEDLYSARMEYDHVCVRLNWKITGPRKDESISYLYR
jgi:hypothetical protein